MSDRRLSPKRKLEKILVASIVLAVGYFLFVYVTAKPELIVVDCKMSPQVEYNSFTKIDETIFTDILVTLKNEGSATAKIDEISILYDDSVIAYKDSYLGYYEVKPGEEKTFVLRENTFGALERKIGQDYLQAKIKIKLEGLFSDEIEKEILISIPMAKFGEIISLPNIEIIDHKPTIGGITVLLDPCCHNYSLTLVSWRETKIYATPAIPSSHCKGYYNPSCYRVGEWEYLFQGAEPGMKFVIITYKVKNNWIRKQSPPPIDSFGEIATDKGYVYEQWTPDIEDVKRWFFANATWNEVKTIINWPPISTTYIHSIPPNTEAFGSIVFEVPEDETPIEAKISSLSYIIKFQPSTWVKAS
ncbi:hypothetical protein DRO97_02165 [Archaeoglobales archaeon]|nr:MAG: hypothetical protein DRO97_02165 [Archaeoglobales archaeon]